MPEPAPVTTAVLPATGNAILFALECESKYVISWHEMGVFEAPDPGV